MKQGQMDLGSWGIQVVHRTTLGYKWHMGQLFFPGQQ